MEIAIAMSMKFDQTRLNLLPRATVWHILQKYANYSRERFQSLFSKDNAT
jgi:hypothetical protein